MSGKAGSRGPYIAEWRQRGKGEREEVGGKGREGRGERRSDTRRKKGKGEGDRRKGGGG